ncbi:MAG: thrombospondin, partial [Nitrosopumilus sp.]|nr:thrombospondin type 3 repeat-containing protein [Nitrosopumilus sp.]NNL38205.1 thrombospondin [Nitrosopumilus sp.]
MPINPAFANGDDLDNDGVANSVDACPNLQEDYESTVDGCPSNFVPWYDEDYDGIEDHIDQCPNLKEHYNKFQDEDGCPDTLPGTGPGGAPDSDGDGFIDLVDLCPNQPETYNGILDRDGCPDSYGSGDRDRDGVP